MTGGKKWEFVTGGGRCDPPPPTIAVALSDKLTSIMDGTLTCGIVILMVTMGLF